MQDMFQKQPRLGAVVPVTANANAVVTPLAHLSSPLNFKIIQQQPYSGKITAMGYSQEGHWRAIAIGNHILLEDLQSSALLPQALSGHTDTVTGVAFNRQGHLVSSSQDKTLKIWNMSGQCLFTLTGHQGSVNCVVIDADDYIVSGSEDKTLKIWNAKGECQTTFVGHHAWINCVAILDKKRIVSGDDDGMAHIWDIQGQILATLTGHTSAVTSIAITKHHQIITGSYDKTLRIWNVQGQPQQLLTDHTARVTALAITDDGIIAGCDLGTLKYWDRQGQCYEIMADPNEVAISCLTQDNQGQLIVASDHGTLTTWQYQRLSPQLDKIQPNVNPFYTKAHQHFLMQGVPQELALYITPDITKTLQSEQRHGLPDIIHHFLNPHQTQDQVLLLLGDSGSGKSLSTQWLEQDLWKKAQQDVNAPIPMRIELKRFHTEADIKECLSATLKRDYGCDDKEITWLKQHGNFIFIFDGYDEIKSQLQFNLYETNNLQTWLAKVIVTCRTQYFSNQQQYNFLFAPSSQGAMTQGLQTWYLAPFSHEQVEHYLQCVSQTNNNALDVTTHYRSLVPETKQLLQSPFLLALFTQALPMLLKSSDLQNSKNVSLRRIDIYQAFMQRWFEREGQRLINRLGVCDIDLLIKSFVNFSQALAYTMVCQGVVEVDYQPTPINKWAKTIVKAASLWEPFFTANDEETVQARAGCPLKRSGEYRYSFIHKSFLEYFALEHYWQALSDLEAAREIWREGILPKEPAILEFFAERLKDMPIAQIQMLWQLIELSKTDATMAQAASNAITVLNWANIAFSGKDLSGIRVPGADLQGAILDHTNLTKADLAGVNFRNAFLRQANLTDANFTDVQFGEWPHREYQGSVSAIAYSPDGQWRAVAVKSDIIIELALTGEQQCILEEYEDYIKSLVWDNQQRLISASRDKTIKVWDIAQETCLHTLLGHSYSVNCLVVDKEGQLISGSDDNTLKVWDIEKAQCLKTLRGHTDRVWCLSLMPQGQVLSGSDDGTIKVWDIVQGVCLQTLDHQRPVLCLTLSPQGCLVSGGYDGNLKVWDLEHGICLRTLISHTDSIDAVVIDTQGRLVSGGGNLLTYTLKVWDIEQGVCLQTIMAHSYSIRCLMINPQGYVESGSFDNTVKVWDLAPQGSQRSWLGHRRELECLIVDGAGRIISGSFDNTIKVWDMARGECLQTLIGHTDWVWCLAITAQGQLVSGSGDKTLKVWNIEQSECLFTLTGHTGSIRCLAISPQGLLLSGSAYGAIKVWDLVQRQCVATWVGHTHWVRSLAVTPQGQLVSASDDKTLKVWDMPSGKCLATFTEPEYISCLVTDGQGQVISSGRYSENRYDSVIKIWDMVQRKCLKTVVRQATIVKHLAINPQGLLIAANDDSTIKVWDMAQGQCLVTIKEDITKISALCVLPTGDILTGHIDGALRRWQPVYAVNGQLIDYQLIFSTHQAQGPLRLDDCCIEGAKGLSAQNQQLLEQRGAVGTPQPVSSTSSELATTTVYSTVNRYHYFPSTASGTGVAATVNNNNNAINNVSYSSFQK